MRNPKGSVKAWVEQEQGKHLCECGCGQPVKILPKHFRYGGIPKRIYAHKISYFPTEIVTKWVEENQGKHFCNCGCEKPITINRNHHWQGIPKTIQEHKTIWNIDDFWRRVHKTKFCWIWKGTISTGGYGILSWDDAGNRQVWSAHRFSYRWHYGEIPEGLEICHHCDNPPCINPKHLFAGTHEDNMQDCAKKGKAAMKLEYDQVLNLVDDREKGMSFRGLARKYNLDKTTVKCIVTGKNWSWLTGIKS